MSGSANVLALDVKGELMAITMHGLAKRGIRAYVINPYQLHGYRGHKVALLTHLTPQSPTLVGDSRRMWNALLPDVSGPSNSFFDTKGRFWGDAITRGLVHERGSVSLGLLFETISMIRADWSAWLKRAEDLAAHSPPDVGAALMEMITMNEGESRTYDSIMSGLTNAMAFMADPALQETFVEEHEEEHEADFTLDVFTGTSGAPVVVYCVMPPELIEPNGPVLRQLFSTLRTVKQRAPHARPVYPVIDEAAALGKYPEIAEFFSIGRGFSFSPIVCYQGLGQVERNLGRTGAMTLSANAALELYLGGGIRDYNTAKLLSDRCGSQTIAVDEKLVQERAKYARRNALRAAILEGADPLKISLDLRKHSFEAQHVRKQRRALLEPDEVLSLGSEHTLVVAGGYALMPFIAQKVPYYQRRDLVGRFFPNPYVDRDMTRIKVPTLFGMKRRKVIETNVPSKFAHLPQYADNRPFRYIDGCKPH